MSFIKIIATLLTLVGTSLAEDVAKWKSQLMAYEYCLLGKVVEGRDKKLNRIEVSILYWGVEDRYLSQRLNIPKSKHIPVGTMVFVCVDVYPPKHGSARYSYILRKDGPIMFQKNELTERGHQRGADGYEPRT